MWWASSDGWYSAFLPSNHCIIPYHWPALHPHIFAWSLPLHVIPVQPRGPTWYHQDVSRIIKACKTDVSTSPSSDRAGWSGHFNGALCFTDADGAGEAVDVTSSKIASFHVPTQVDALLNQHELIPGPGDWWWGPWCCNSGAHPGGCETRHTPNEGNIGNRPGIPNYHELPSKLQIPRVNQSEFSSTPLHNSGVKSPLVRLGVHRKLPTKIR